MASFTITIPDGIVNDFINAVADKGNYQTEVLDEGTGDMIPNPESKVQFSKRYIRSELKEIYYKYKLKELVTARQQILAGAITDMENVDVV